ncbi:lysylphosphatidylglycerol synthase transmembrane domain-containing protein [Methanimicrococcus hacksteinii]|uniref:lysylphosphatidylglycerol synthase transmembrane domain-containing protein n=1 Tax=Methanimicrococcus hacksteinii TaxID=3028293 RepID=UPI00298F3283|nr:lysylphosphatidylglycerol synthase transmembrane domain-containing protein [Methanimicrococcus sp. At1]
MWIIILLLFAVLLRSMNLSEIIDSLKSITLPLLLLLAGLQLLTQLLLNYQWCHIAGAMGLKAKFWKMFYINCKGTLTEAITPGAKVGGEVVRGYLFKSEFGCSTADAASLVAIQKIISVGSLILLNLIALLFLPASVSFLTPVLKIVLFLVMAAVLILFILLLFRPQILSDKLASYDFKRPILQKLQKGLIEFSEHAQKIRNGKTLLFQLALSVFIWALFPFKLAILAGRYQSGISPLAILGATLTAYFIAMIPVSPGGLGVFEVTLSSLLIMFGLTSEQAVITAVVFRFFTFWFVILYSLAVIFFYDVYHKIKKSRAEKKQSVSVQSVSDS